MDGIPIDSQWASLLAQAAPPVAGTAGSNGADEQPAMSQPGTPLGPNGGARPGAPGGFDLLLPMMLGLVVLMIVTSVVGGRKEKKRRTQMLSSLARYDRVVTSGGVIGTIVEIRDDEVVLKVDESTNTKIHFARSSVQSVLKRGPGSGVEPAENAA